MPRAAPPSASFVPSALLRDRPCVHCGRRTVCACLRRARVRMRVAHDEHGAIAMIDDLGRGGAEQVIERVVSVRSDDDEIDVELFRRGAYRRPRGTDTN